MAPGIHHERLYKVVHEFPIIAKYTIQSGFGVGFFLGMVRDTLTRAPIKKYPGSIVSLPYGHPERLNHPQLKMIKAQQRWYQRPDIQHIPITFRAPNARFSYFDRFAFTHRWLELFPLLAGLTFLSQCAMFMGEDSTLFKILNKPQMVVNDIVFTSIPAIMGFKYIEGNYWYVGGTDLLDKKE